MDKTYNFSGQRQGEKVLEIVKNHPFILFFPGIKSILILILGISGIIFWSGQLSGLLMTVCILVGFGIFFRAYYDYNQSVFLITNFRVINVGQRGFWRRKITETELNKIQDVSSSTTGFFRIMLKFGDLTIRTAGASQGTEIIVENIPNPYNVQQRIVNIRTAD